MRKFIIPFACGVVMLAATAQAQQAPRYDVESHCEQVASVGGSPSNTMYNSCIEMEQQAYDNIKQGWSSIPGGTQQHCDQVATVGGAGSYTMLESCVQMETQAADDRSEFNFD
ncbi:hypothetical protein [Chromohalobacter nigrandesensis]|uniref:hypothetical protein n=1 Tax=Chromohalobacter nigrandesensis TaxID=119863 RepID=UPI001FF52829|nr:hypothetical protein [Chromohalobacter nigrandesensis]MCK0743549.1 hypothetical protein [Chromohalobacter nigrandesensis]